MNKSTPKKKQKQEKTIFQSAGEVIGTIGHEIVLGKEKVVEAARAVANTFSAEKKTIKKAGNKVKKSARKIVARKTVVKKKLKKAAKNAGATTKKTIRKVAKKASRLAKKK